MLPLLLLLSLPQEAEPIEGGAQDAPSVSAEALLEVGLPLERSRADLLPPAGALGRGWMMRAGELAVTVEQSTSTFRGMRDGTQRVEAPDLLGTWSQVRRASRSRWTVEGRYGLSENVTVSAALPFESRHIRWQGAGASGRTAHQGVGDLELTADVRLLEQLDERLVVGGGLVAPTGEHDARDAWSGTPDALLPYWLQVGGGTWQGLVSASWIRQEEGWAWGTGARGTLPFEKNDAGWARERTLALDAWAARPLGRGWIGSARLQASGWSDVRGAADEADPSRSPLEDNGRQGGDRLDASIGLAVDLSPPATGLTNRLEFSVGTPLWEDLDGPGPAAELHFAFRWRATL